LSALTDPAQLGIYATAFGAALLGSAHCFGMCGGIAAVCGPKRALTYQGGRLLGYLGVGVVAGSMGSGVYRLLEDDPRARLTATLALCILFLLQAFAWWRGNADARGPLSPALRWIAKVVDPLRARAARSGGSFLIGVFTAILPCGWIASFALLAAARGSAEQGALLFALLWAGSLPALLFATFGSGWLRHRFRGAGARAVIALVVLLSGFASVHQRWNSTLTRMPGGSAESTPHCAPPASVTPARVPSP
jgi:sulfite exporter TauE/SafE